jgi:thiol-disulfide isomerase/thioredoxin
MLQGGVATLLAASLHEARASALKVGAPAPPATLVTLDGERIATPDLLGHVLILTFWATWCEPCREELPMLSGYASRHADAGLRVLAFCLDGPERLPEVRRVAETLRFPVGLLAYSSAHGYGRIWRLPVSFTIDQAGRLVDNGWDSKTPALTAEHLERVVTPLLGQAAAAGREAS